MRIDATSSAAGHVSEFFGQVHRFDRAIQVEIRTEFAPTRTPAHGRHHFVAHDDDADVTAVAFGHVVLNQHIPACVKQPLDEALRFVGRVAKEYALPLRAFGDFDNHGQPSDGFDGVFDVTHVTHNTNPKAKSISQLGSPLNLQLWVQSQF